jgi:hypothetical protein
MKILIRHYDKFNKLIGTEIDIGKCGRNRIFDQASKIGKKLYGKNYHSFSFNVSSAADLYKKLNE